MDNPLFSWVLAMERTRAESAELHPTALLALARQKTRLGRSSFRSHRVGLGVTRAACLSLLSHITRVLISALRGLHEKGLGLQSTGQR